MRSHRKQDDFLELLKDTSSEVLHRPILDIKSLENSEKIKKQISNFDEFDIDRSKIFNSIPRIIQKIKNINDDKDNHQTNLFSDQNNNQIEFEFEDVFIGLVKAAIFGFIITLMGCYHGYYSGRGAEGVGKATTNAVVSASILILIANYTVTALFFG